MKHAIIILIGILFFMALGNTAQPDAEIIKKEIHYTLNTDGSTIKEYSHQVKLNSYLACRRLFGETFVIYNPDFQKLEILKSETTMKDGKKVSSPGNAFNEVLPSDAHLFPHLAHLREMVITHTGLECGAVVDLHYKITTKPGFLPYFTGEEYFTDEYPIQHALITITIPKNCPFKYQLLNVSAAAEEKSKANHITYSFNLSQIPPYIQEPDDKGREFHQRIIFTTAENWQQLFPSTFSAEELPPSLLNRISDIKHKTLSENQLIFELQNLITSTIDNQNSHELYTGGNLRNYAEIYQENYGSKLEKAYLFQKMLSYFQIQSELLAIPKDSQFTEEIPTFLQIKNYLLKTTGSGKSVIYLNPWEKNNNLFIFQHTHKQFYNITAKAFEPLDEKYQTSEKNSVLINGQLKQEHDKVSGMIHLEIHGFNNNYYDAFTDIAKYSQKFLSQYFPIDTLRVDKINSLSFSETNVDVEITGQLIKKGNFVQTIQKISFPEINEGLIALKSRNQALYIDQPFRIEFNIQLQHQPDLTADFLAENTLVENSIGHYQQKVSIQPNNTLAINQKIEIAAFRIQPEQYDQFKRIITACINPAPLVIFRHIPSPLIK